jgi:hypothetical protein
MSEKVQLMEGYTNSSSDITELGEIIICGTYNG